MISRRQFVKNSSSSVGWLSLPSFINHNPNKAGGKVICIGGHPDDPESGCGGTLALLQKAGHEIVIIYLTTGEAGIPGKMALEAATIRKQEAINACKELKARPVFFGEIDGSTVFDNDSIKKMIHLLDNEKPDLLFTQWPIDTHQDHQVASILSIHAWVRSARKYPVYFYEVCTGEQSLIFHPTEYVDITGTQEQKRKAIYCHISQDPPGIYACGHASMEEFRGREAGVKAAEAFVKLSHNSLKGIIDF